MYAWMEEESAFSWVCDGKRWSELGSPGRGRFGGGIVGDEEF